MKENIIFSELYKVLSKSEKRMLTRLMHSKKTERVKEILIFLLKKYHSKLAHLI